MARITTRAPPQSRPQEHREQEEQIQDAGGDREGLRYAPPATADGGDRERAGEERPDELVAEIHDEAPRPRGIRDLEGDQAPVHLYRDPDGDRYKAMVERIRDFLRIDSLAFQRIEDLKKAIGLKGVCTYCWTGEDSAMPGSCSHGCTSCGQTCPSRIHE